MKSFLRRAHIDICGTLPTPEEHDAFRRRQGFAKARQAGRRSAFAQGVRRHVGDEVGGTAGDPLGQPAGLVTRTPCSITTGWKTRSSTTCRSIRSCRNILGANGGTFKNPATNYYQITTDTLKVAENTAQVFMGMRIQCAQCHNHPFDRWTMNDYYGFAAFFSQVGRKPAEDKRETIVFNRGNGEVNHPVGGRRRQAQVPGRRYARRRRQGSPGRARQVAGFRRQPLLRQESVEHRLGALLRQGDHRSGR